MSNALVRDLCPRPDCQAELVLWSEPSRHQYGHACIECRTFWHNLDSMEPVGTPLDRVIFPARFKGVQAYERAAGVVGEGGG